MGTAGERCGAGFNDEADLEGGVAECLEDYVGGDGVVFLFLLVRLI